MQIIKVIGQTKLRITIFKGDDIVKEHKPKKYEVLNIYKSKTPEEREKNIEKIIIGLHYVRQSYKQK